MFQFRRTRIGWVAVVTLVGVAIGFAVFRSGRTKAPTTTPTRGGTTIALGTDISPLAVPIPEGPTAQIVNPNLFSVTDNGSTLLATGTDGAILRSSDRGLTFLAATTPVETPINEVAFTANPATWFAVGKEGTLLVSHDDGKNFAGFALSSKPELYTVHAFGTRFVITGANGLLLECALDGQSCRSFVTKTTSNLAFAALTPEQTHLFTVGDLGPLLVGTRGGDWRSYGIDTTSRVTALGTLGEQIVLVGLENGEIRRSPNGGASFASVVPAREHQIISAIASSSDGSLLVATATRGRVLYSRDQGQTFSVWETGRSRAFTKVIATRNPRQFVAIGANGLVVRLEPLTQQLTDLSLATTSRVMDGTALPNGDLLVTGAGGLIARSAADASAMTVVTPGLSEVMLAATTDSVGTAVVAVGKAPQAYRLVDGGKTATTVTLPVKPVSTLSAIVNDTQHRVLVASGTGGVLLRSTDGGASWTRIADVTGNVEKLLLARDGSLWAMPLGQPLLRSTDGAVTWQPVPVAPNVTVTQIFGGIRPSTILAATREGQLYRSTDLGSRFSPLSIDLKDIQLQVAEREPARDTLWIAGTRGSLYGSKDDGLSWKQVVIPSDETLNAIAFPATQGQLLALGNRGTLLRVDTRTFSAERVELKTSEHLRFSVSDPRTRELYIGGTGGLLLFSRDGRTFQQQFSHSTARYADGLWDGTTQSLVFVGERILRLTPHPLTASTAQAAASTRP